VQPTKLILSSGVEIEVQTPYSQVPSSSAPGVDEAASPLDKLTAQDWGGAMERVAELANESLARLRDKIQPCKEVAVEFGVSIGGKSGIILVEGTVNANLKVTLKW
jgi:Trypsin-co-occurring domain 1